MTKFLRIMPLSLMLLSNACTVGPDYRRPEVKAIPAHFKEQKGWKQAQPDDEKLSEKWWLLFKDPYLNTLIEQVSINNQSLAQAEAQFRQAQALVQGAQAAYFPTVTASATTNRFRAATGQSVAVSGVRSLFGTALSVAWEPDIWGNVRRQVEANQATAQASFATLQALRLSAQATLLQNYFQLRTLDAQKQILTETIVAYSKALKITENQYNAGILSKADVIQAKTQLATIQAQRIDLGMQRAALEHAIALLMGRMPNELSIPFSGLPEQLPAIPTGIPSQLLERRPDIATAERQMAAANAQIGVAKAAYFPMVSLSSTNGYQSGTLSNLISTASRYWALGPAAFVLPLFDGGARGAQMAGSIDAYDASVAAYRQTVLTSFQQVEDNLAALRILEEEAQAQDEAVKLARENLRLTLNQFKAGTVSFLNVMIAQTTDLTNQNTAAILLGQRFNAMALLIKALGGGWHYSQLPSIDKVGGKAKWSQFLPIPKNDWIP